LVVLGTGNPIRPGSLLTPSGVAVDSTGNVYIVDEGNYWVLEYDRPSAPVGNCTPNPAGSGCPGDTIADRVFALTAATCD